MKIIANGVNGTYFRDLIDNAPVGDIEAVFAAVAYVSGTPRLIDHCFDKNIPLTLWGRLDHTIPVSTNVLSRFLKGKSIHRCKLVWRFFHPKVIWLKGYGAYIGSSNFSKSEFRNIECGVFMNQQDLEDHRLLPELNDIFKRIDAESFALTEELFNKLKGIEDEFANSKSDLSLQQRRLINEFDTRVGNVIPKKFNGLTFGETRKSAIQRRKNTFLEEWNNTYALLRKIQTQAVEHRPSWVQSDVSGGVQLDQFLHAYYYSQATDGRRSIHEELHVRNKSNAQAALDLALEWWKGLPAAPTHEDEFMYIRAPYLQKKLMSQKIRSLTEEEFITVCKYIHAFIYTARQTRNETVELPSATKLGIEERAKTVARWLWRQNAGNGSRPLDVLYHVLYGGSTDDITDRIFKSAFLEEWHLPRFGLSCLGELVGWALPDKFPPRNGRTSKALFALGFDVTVYGD